MKPMKVSAGDFAPDVDELIEKANNMDDMLAKVASLTDDSQMRNITGVEEAPMTHYWTNQQQPDIGIENVSKKNIGPENVTMLEANPHQTGSTLAAHENTAGGIRKAAGAKPDYLDMDGDGNKTESMKDALKNKKDKKIGIKKGAKKCPCGSGKMAPQCCNGASEDVSKAPPMPPMGGDKPMPPMGGGGAPPSGGGDDMAGLAALLGGAGDEGGKDVPDDPEGISDMLMELGKKVKALGGGGDMPAPDMPMGGDDEGGGSPPPLPM